MTNVTDVLSNLKKDNFKINAGSTSNCTYEYSIEAVAETISGKHLQIIVSQWCGRWATTPIEFMKSRGDKHTYTALSNFGTPQVSRLEDKREALEDAIKRFNYEVEPCESLEFSHLERIARIITKDGEEIRFI